jgi:endonuclease-3
MKPSDPRRAHAALILRRLHRLYPEANCELRHASPFELLVATILSAQCTDARVNAVTPALFRRFPTPQAMARARPGAIERIIRSCGFYNAKGKSIRGAAKRLVEAYGGEIPRTMDDLLTLPGVARKTANVVLGTAFGLATGVVVDTHIHRLSRRLRLTRQDDPEKIEKDLMKAVPRKHWIFFGHALIWHGRRVCAARKPACYSCDLADICPFEPKTPQKPSRLLAPPPPARRSGLPTTLG